MTNKKEIQVAAVNKILTVVIPTYNMEKYLRRCLDSLIVSDQQMQMLEVLVINDGSKDTSSQIAHEYQDRYPQTFRVIDKENGNYGSCVNRGLDEATGKYIKVLDADDWFDNANFRTYLDTVKDLDVDLVLNDMVYYREGKGVYSISHFRLPKQKGFYFFDYRQFPRMHNIAYKRNKVRALKYHQTEGISYTDGQWTFLPMSMVEKAFYLPLSIYVYLVGREGQTTTPEMRKKCINQQNLMLKDELIMFSTRSFTKDATSWLKARLVGQIGVPYRDALIEFKDYANRSLQEFDILLKSDYPDIYKETGENLTLSRFFPYKFVKEWRATGKINTFSIQYLMFKLYQAVKPIAKQLILSVSNPLKHNQLTTNGGV